MNNIPTVSVVMPVYNTARYLSEAVDSILEQTLNDFEFIIVNDGSTDDSPDILGRYQQSDKRIRVFHQKNSGLAASLNVGLRAAKGKYIARMDSDDISLQERLARQVEFMDNHPDVGVCGTAFRQFGNINGDSWTMTDPEEIKSRLMFWPCLGHPTVMMRRELIIKENLYYDIEFKQAEDHELWLRFSQHCKITNIPEVLLLYRTRDNQATHMFRDDVIDWSGRIHKQAIGVLGIELSDDEIMLHRSLHTSKIDMSRDYVERVERWLCKLYDANESRCVYDKMAFARVIFERWCYVCSNEAPLGLWIWVKFRKSRIYAESRRAGCSSSISFARQFMSHCISKFLNKSAFGRYVKNTVRKL